jgi:hypothetical protein
MGIGVGLEEDGAISPHASGGGSRRFGRGGWWGIRACTYSKYVNKNVGESRLEKSGGSRELLPSHWWAAA